MQKEVKVAEYLKVMTRALKLYCHKKECSGISKYYIQAQAYIFFDVFGLEITNNLVEAYDNIDKKYDEESYKCLFLLCKNMEQEESNVFIATLRSCCYELDEEVSH